MSTDHDSGKPVLEFMKAMRDEFGEFSYRAVKGDIIVEKDWNPHWSREGGVTPSTQFNPQTKE